MSAKCSACQAPIIWLKTTNGRSMPLDVTPNPEGNVVIKDGLAVVLGGVEAADPLIGERRFMPHWSTCPHAAEFRKAKKP